MILTGDHRRLPHPLQRSQSSLNLTQLNAIPADLDLLINPTHILQLPITTPGTKSPVRYIRDPEPPNGHATNRDPVNPARFT